MTFEEFINDFKTNRCLKDSNTAKKIYVIISREDVRIEMVWLSNHGLTALSACSNEIEEICEEADSDLSLDTKIVRQTIGRMCAASLAPLGYTPYKQGRVNAGHSKYFTTAKVYKYSGGEVETIIPAKIIKL